MDLSISFIDAAVAVAGAIVIGQALMVVTLVASDASERDAHRWLVLMLLAVAAVSAGDVAEHLHLADRFSWLLPFSAASLLCIGPALWLYVKALTRPAAPVVAVRHKPSRPALWHFIPAALLAAGLLLGRVYDGPPSPSPGPRREFAELLYLAPIALQLVLYSVAVIRRVFEVRTNLKQEYSTLDGRTLDWLLLTACLFLAVLVAWVMSWAVSVATSDLLTNVLSAAVLGIAGARGARQKNVFARLRPADAAPLHSAASRRPIESAPQSEPEALPGEADAATAVKYARSALASETALALRTRLQQTMELDKPFLENDLTLADLSRRVGATPHQLSQLFSQHLGETFFDFINRHRVDAVKTTLARPQAAGRPLLEIALECGFGSKSTFNDTFRRLTGMSPSEYRRRQPGAAAAAR